jgi:hypothetical protein
MTTWNCSPSARQGRLDLGHQSFTGTVLQRAITTPGAGTTI